jgi:hypothetical protein
MNESNLASLVARTLQLLGANAASAGTALLLLTGGATALDLLLPDDSIAVSNIPLTIALLCAASIVTRAAMARAGLAVAGDDLRFGTLFGISLLGNLGIILGLLLLVIPGLYLSARWFMAVPAMFAEDRSASDALGTSWQATREHAWPLVGLTLLVYLPPFVLAVLVNLFASLLPAAAMSATTNMMVYGSVIIGWHAAVATYAALRGSEARLEEVFA